MKLLYIPLLLLFFAGQSYGSADSLYNFKWLDDDEHVYVIQNKEFTKSKSFGIDVSLLTSNSSSYHDTMGFSGAITYYLNENFSIDLTRKQYNNDDNKDLKNLNKLLSGTTSGVKPLLRTINSATILHANWIPFYGKINIFNKILFFDMGIGLGLGMYETEGNYKTFNIPNQKIVMVKENDQGVDFNFYLKFFTRSKITFGLSQTFTVVNTIKTADGTKTPHYFMDSALTIGYIF